MYLARISLHSPAVCIMLSFVLSRSFCQGVTEATRRCYPTVGSIFRTFSTSSPACEEASDNGSVVTYSELKTMLASHNIQLFDVRNPDEYKAGHIAGRDILKEATRSGSSEKESESGEICSDVRHSHPAATYLKKLYERC